MYLSAPLLDRLEALQTEMGYRKLMEYTCDSLMDCASLHGGTHTGVKLEPPGHQLSLTVRKVMS